MNKKLLAYLTAAIFALASPAWAGTPDTLTIADKSAGGTLTHTEFNTILDAIKDGTVSTKTQSVIINGVQGFFATGLEGATAGDLATVPVAKIQDGAIGIVSVASTGVGYLYYFDVDGTDAESVPAVIRPNDYATAGVWKLHVWPATMLPTATDSAQGAVELATDAETVTGSATNRAVTPANVTARLAAPGAIGGTTPGSGSFTNVTINDLLITPPVAFSDGDTTPDVSGFTVGITANTGATSISGFDAGAGSLVNGQVLLVIVNDAVTTFDFTSSGLVGTSSDYLASSGETLLFVYSTTTSKWHYLGSPKVLTGTFKIGSGTGLGLTTASQADGTLARLEISEQYVVGRATGGNVTGLAIDSDLSSVSANDDTVPSAKATKAYADLMLPLAGGTMTGNIEFGHASDTTISRPGAGVIAVEGLSLPRIVASGAATFDPGSTADGACSSAVDGGTATGVATTDRIVWNPSGDPTSTTGYNPSGDIGSIWAYPASDHVYFKFCNKSGSAIDPGSITINWMVLR